MYEIQAYHRERREWIAVKTFPTAFLAMSWARREYGPGWGYQVRVAGPETDR